MTTATSHPQGVNIELELVRANDRVPLPRVVMGPVVGKCTSTSAVVVLEVGGVVGGRGGDGGGGGGGVDGDDVGS